jgi:NADH-quinone oxidoreductase subunit H
VWFIFYQPLLAIIFFTCVLAECNRAPFDLAEAEQELVGGYHTEYASMKWALFFLGEYLHMITGCALFCVLFLGGWDAIPFVGEMDLVATGIGLVLLKFVVFLIKVTILLAFMMLIRWTLPRFRFDQLMRLAWRSLIPVSLALLLVSGLVVYYRASPWWFLAGNVGVFVVTMLVGPLIPAGPPVNRRVGLPGSRFSPPKPVEA